MNDEMSKIELLGLLNILLYLDGVDGISLQNGMTVGQNIMRFVDRGVNSENNKRRVKILRNAMVKYRYFSELKINFHVNNDFSACVFIDYFNNYYIGFRGTKWNEWTDDIIALSGLKANTKTQLSALEYFNKAIELFNLSHLDNIVLFGHSNGGLKSQYILINSDKSDWIDDVYAFCSQKFAKEAYEKYFSDKDEQEMLQIINKIHLIDSKGDFVHLLGYKKDEDYFLPLDDTLYFDTNYKGLFRPHFADGIYKLDGSIDEIVSKDDISKTEETAMFLSNIFMKLNPMGRRIVGSIVVGFLNFNRRIHVDKIVDHIDRNRN